MKLRFRFIKKDRKTSKRTIQYIVGMLIMLLAAVAFSQEHLRQVLFSQKAHDYSGLTDEAPKLANAGEKPRVAKARRRAPAGGAPALHEGSFFMTPPEYQPAEASTAPPKRKVLADQNVYTPITIPSQHWNNPPDDYSPSYSIPPVYNRVSQTELKASVFSSGTYTVTTGNSNESNSDEENSGSSGNGSGLPGSSGGLDLGGGGTGESGDGNVPIPPAAYLLGVGFAVVARRMRKGDR
ncbi:MAG: hypothetical protein AB7W37_08520 [Syntrophobacteraceae bacterium]